MTQIQADVRFQLVWVVQVHCTMNSKLPRKKQATTNGYADVPSGWINERIDEWRRCGLQLK